MASTARRVWEAALVATALVAYGGTQITPVETAALTPPARLADCVTSGTYVPPPDLTLAEWAEDGHVLAARYSTVLWNLADWAAIGVRLFGTAARPYLGSVTRRSPDSIRKMIGLARAFPPERRRSGVAFSFHALVRGLPAEDANRFLDRARDERLRYHELARQVKAFAGRPAAPARSAPRRARPDRAIVRPATLDGQNVAPIPCSGCFVATAFTVGRRAVQTRGPSAIQRRPGGELVVVMECPACGSTTMVSLALLELPLPLAAPVGSEPARAYRPVALADEQQPWLVAGVKEHECEACGHWTATGVTHRCPAARGLVPDRRAATGGYNPSVKYASVPYTVKAT